MNKFIDKATDLIILVMTILTPIFFFVGVFGMDTPDTIVPEVLLGIALAWVGFIIYCCKDKNATEINK